LLNLCARRIIAHRYEVEISVSLTRTELKDIQSLLTKKGRRTQGRFLAEGVRVLEEALRHRVRPQQLMVMPQALSQRGIELVEGYRRLGVLPLEVSAKQLESLSDTQAPQGMIGLFEFASGDLSELSRSEARNVLVCENVADPGNLGTLIRSALAFDFGAVVTMGETAEPFSPKVVRGSVGAIFGVTIVSADSPEQVLTAASHGKSTLLAAAPRGETSSEALVGIAKRQQIWLVVGSEADGISEKLMQAAGGRIRIEHSELVESLNVAVAGSILMKEIYSLCTHRN
jgi:RNA methyltransferase, TrmH family